MEGTGVIECTNHTRQALTFLSLLLLLQQQLGGDLERESRVARVGNYLASKQVGRQ